MNSEVKKVLFIVNKFSGAGYQPALEGAIISGCERNDKECIIEFTTGRGHATELARAVAANGSADLVVAVGGDGTVNEVATGLLHSDTPMAILPKGSGNGLARHLGIPMNFPGAIDTLYKSKPISMDAFTLNDRLSLNVSGIGFDGHVANLFGTTKKRGLQGYARVTISEFMRFKEFEAELYHTGNVVEKRQAFVIAIANSSQYGNNARIAPAASVADGILHVSFLKKVPAYRLDFVYDFFAGNIGTSSFCEIIEVTRLLIKVKTPVAFHIDGEPGGVDTTFDIRILPASLRMYVPASSLRY